MIRTLIRASMYVKRKLGFAFRRHTIRLLNPNCVIGHGVSIGKNVTVRVTDGGRLAIGNNTTIKSNCVLIVKNGNLQIGANSFVGWGTIICANEHISIGKNALIAEYVTIRDQNHGTEINGTPFSQQPAKTSPIKIEDNVWLGAKVTVVAGASIGFNSVIGSNAVVTNPIGPNTVAVGVPARQIKTHFPKKKLT